LRCLGYGGVTDIVTPDVEQYAADHTSPEPPHLVALAEETRTGTAAPGMMTGKLEGRFLKMLVHLLQPEIVLEIGTFTGYSALSMAEALPPGGRIITCDVSEEHVAIARRHIDASPYADRIELRVGPALDTIAGLQGPFDFVFIDADKTNYRNYYDAVLPKLSDRGAIAIDNVLWSGEVLAPKDDNGRAIAELNDFVAGDDRVDCVMVTVRDGVTLVRKRPRR
jgi:caffeoyl-CoA O-methyltransferase